MNAEPATPLIDMEAPIAAIRANFGQVPWYWQGYWNETCRYVRTYVPRGDYAPQFFNVESIGFDMEVSYNEAGA